MGDEMIRQSSDKIIKASKTVQIVHMKTKKQVIAGHDCIVTLADVLSKTRGGVYRVIVRRLPHPSRSHATCMCQGALFTGNCKHIHAVICKSRQEQV